MGSIHVDTWHRSRACGLALLLATVVYATNGAAQNTKPADHSLHFHLATASWSPPYDGPLGYPKGAQRAPVSVDSVSGGETYYAHFPAGSRFNLHWHSHGEFAVVLRGKVTHVVGTERQSLVAGDYVTIPPNMNHAWEVDAREDVYLLIRRDGPADFHFVEK